MLENIRLANMRNLRKDVGDAHRWGPALSCFCLWTLCPHVNETGLACWRMRGTWREASAVLFLPTFPASPSFTATLADAPDVWMRPANIMWKKRWAGPTEPSPNCLPTELPTSKSLLFESHYICGVFCYTAKAMWYTNLLITTFVNRTRSESYFSVFLPV